MKIFDFLRSQPGEFFALPRKSAGEWVAQFMHRDRMEEDYLRRHAGDDLYFCPNGFNAAASLWSNVVPGHWLYADLDENNPSLCRPRPTMAWRTSMGRYQAMWRVDRFDEEVNRRLTYHLGAHIEGWASNRALRIPGTTNYKYPLRGRVELLWENGARYSNREILQYLPATAPPAEKPLPPAVEEFDEASLPRETLRLLNQKRTVRLDDRTRILRLLIAEFVERGVGEDQTVARLKATVWNKWADKADGGDAALRREYRKAGKEGG
jgi:RepB DNA-primase from phage plasmid